MKKLLSMLLAAAMLVSAGAMAFAEGTSKKGTIVYGSSTELGGDFAPSSWWTNNATDKMVRDLTNDYGVTVTNQGGEYVVNPTIAKNIESVVNPDGSKTFTVTINEGLTYNNGEEIKAADFLWAEVFACSKVAMDTGAKLTGHLTYVGGKDYYDGTATAVSGLRLIDDYTFSVTIVADKIPYYYDLRYIQLQPLSIKYWLGDGVELKDDGEGCYLSDEFYAKDDAGEYVTAAHMSESRYDVSTYPFSGAYVITDWDQGTKQCTLTINPEFKGNFEGQTPSIETIVYVFVVSETQLEQLKTGAVDVLSGITGGDDTKAALAIVDDVNFSEVHYQRAGYGKVEFECDFGPTMFPEVRQAITYLLNRTEFCQTFTGGYGVVVDGPYSPDFDMWKAVQDDIELIDYTFSPDTAKKVLEEGGWIYNSKGEPYVEGATGVDAVRYKKLTAEEANAKDIFGNDAGNKTYASVANTDNVVYKTVEINGEYYMPLAINWFGTTPNNVTDLLNTNLANSSDVAAAGMVIRATTGDFTTLLGNIYRDASMGYGGTPIYGMFNLATGWNNAVYDYAYNWSPSVDYAGYSSNKVIDPYDLAFPYDLAADRLTYEEAVEASGDKLGMDYLSMGMVYNAATEDEYNEWWMAYIERWNELMPDIPLYSNYYYDVYNANIENFVTSPFFGPARAILYSNIKGY